MSDQTSVTATDPDSDDATPLADRVSAYDAHYTAMASRNFYAELLALRDEQRQFVAAASAVVEGDKIPWESTPQGQIRWYVAPTMKDVTVSTYTIYALKIMPGSRSGKQLVPGDEIAFVWQGRNGYSEINGTRYDWGKWTLLQVPPLTNGSTVQHFNTDPDNDAVLIVALLNTVHSFGVDRGARFEQLEACPEWREA